jgi:phosphoribosylaminoimidazole-succinocarboxamide synthase
MVVRFLPPLPVEFVFRVCLTGSAWDEYKRIGGPDEKPREKVSLWGCARVRGGLTQGAWLVDPIFTPTSKAESGHDQPLSWVEYVAEIGDESRARDLVYNGLRITRFMSENARLRGIVLADHKMEIALDSTGRAVLVDELGTPDSSRYWDLEAWKRSRAEGGSLPPALDKQFLRDWLIDNQFNRQPPGPVLPEDVIRNTRERYVEALRRLSS